MNGKYKILQRFKNKGDKYLYFSLPGPFDFTPSSPPPPFPSPTPLPLHPLQTLTFACFLNPPLSPSLSVPSPYFFLSLSLSLSLWISGPIWEKLNPNLLIFFVDDIFLCLEICLTSYPNISHVFLMNIRFL